MITLIGLCGKKSSGKDTVCTIIRAWEKRLVLPVVRYAFADALKADIAQAFGTTVDFINANKKNPVMRKLLQLYGVARREERATFWINKMELKLFENLGAKPNHIAIVTDVRFQNEAEFIRGYGGRIVKIDRGELPLDMHISETELNSITPDFALQNKGSIKMLELEVKYLLEQYNLFK